MNCAQYSEREQLCDYDKSAQIAISKLRPLPIIGHGAAPSDVAAYGRMGEAQLSILLADWKKLRPPPKAEQWHDSMEEWITTSSGGFAILTAVDARRQSEVDAILESFFPLRDGMAIELDQLNREYSRLVQDCP
ncbi:MAG: hypothetical protein EPO22_04185 [Dehalococcoidia bacterium]|nr:MAG: hypothetical protein EPO22_04185 [Dehalococcoidia bacterium]